MTISLSWPIIVILVVWLWAFLTVPIGNWLQEEWWLNVWAFSFFGAIITSVVVVAILIVGSLT